MISAVRRTLRNYTVPLFPPTFCSSTSLIDNILWSCIWEYITLRGGEKWWKEFHFFKIFYETKVFERVLPLNYLQLFEAASKPRKQARNDNEFIYDLITKIVQKDILVKIKNKRRPYAWNKQSAEIFNLKLITSTSF